MKREAGARPNVKPFMKQDFLNGILRVCFASLCLVSMLGSLSADNCYQKRSPLETSDLFQLLWMAA